MIKCKHPLCKDKVSKNIISEYCDYCLIFNLAHDKKPRAEHIHCRQMKYGCGCRCRTNIKKYVDVDVEPILPNAQEKDKNITNKLLEQGYIVLRLWEHEIINNIDDCIKTIEVEL